MTEYIYLRSEQAVPAGLSEKFASVVGAYNPVEIKQEPYGINGFALIASFEDGDDAMYASSALTTAEGEGELSSDDNFDFRYGSTTDRADILKPEQP
jgi:hypothetical protein